MIGSKLKEVWICIKSGVVTAPYPLGPPPQPLPEGFRGRVEIEVEKCVGCGGCANVCPAQVFQIKDLAQDFRVIEIYRERCTYCGRCEEVCQEGAVRLTPEFELATNNKADITDQLEIFMASCQRCGRCFKPVNKVLDRMMETGFRT